MENSRDKLNSWLDNTLPEIVTTLESDTLCTLQLKNEEGLNISGRNQIYEILDDLLAVLFPGAFSKVALNTSDLKTYIDNKLRALARDLKSIIEIILTHHCTIGLCENCNCEMLALDVVKELISKIPSIRKILIIDVNAAFDGDPAAKSIDEVILSYPAIEAIATYRIAHLLYDLKVPLIPRILTERAHSNTGIDINPGAVIGEGFFIDHGTGVVIGETCVIGKRVKVYQGVTLGALSPFDKNGLPRKGEKRHPDIEDNVIIYANATILGGRTVVGKGAVVGGNTWITRSVPAGDVVYSSN